MTTAAPAAGGAVRDTDCLPAAHATWTVWSTTVEVVTTRADELAPARAAVQAVIDAVDLAASRFRTDSEISELNTAEGRPVPASPLFRTLVREGLRVARITDGLIDPTIGELLVAHGYDRDIEELRSTGIRRLTTPVAVVRRPDHTQVVVDDEAGTVRVPAGVVLDLGASAKAWAADAAAQAAARAVDGPVLVGMGGDLAVAGVPEGSPGFLVRLTERPEPEPGEAPPVLVALATGGLATSTTLARRWRVGRRIVHHLIDPRTASPARGRFRTASVAAATCVDANAASAAALMLGESAPTWLANAGLPARLVTTEGTVVPVHPWPEEVAA
ncbi:MAG: FAD:protein FMN transferase [Candidatus Nanopelagicales bacterium]